jgi:protocatechuate 3,4-dioxygenase beta subunit
MTARGLSRREALALLGGSAALAACGAPGQPDAASGSPPTATGSQPAASGSQPAASGSQSASVAGGLAAVTAASFAGAASCALTPEQTEGPYYIDVDKIRADIREDRPGTRLRIGARVMHADGCTPVKDAVFEVWHCDAGGAYSGINDAARYLRGGQVTNAEGIAVITTIYPGWYTGRTTHVHAKVALANTTVLTTQLYFDDALTDTVYQVAPYAAHGRRDTLNTGDGIYRAETTLTVTKDGDGYLGLVTIGVRG